MVLPLLLTPLHSSLIFAIAPRPLTEPHHHLLSPHLPRRLTSCPSDDPPATSPTHFIPLSVPAHAGLFHARFPPPSHRGPPPMPEAPQSPSRRRTHPGRHHLCSAGPSVESRRASQVTFCCYTTTFTTFHMGYTRTPSISHTVGNNVCLCVCVEVGRCCYMRVDVKVCEGDIVAGEHKHRGPM